MKKKEVIINIEVTNKKELFRQLVKAKYLLEEHFEDERRRNIRNSFRNLDICSRKVQIIIKDKKSMFNYFEISEAKEVSEKDHKRLIEILKKDKRTMIGVRKSGRTYKIKIKK